MSSLVRLYLVLAAAASLVAVSCSKEETGAKSPAGGAAAAECPALKVTVDGADVALGAVYGKADNGGILMEANSNAKFDCSEFAKARRTVAPGERSARVFTSDKVKTVSVDAKTQMDPNLDLKVTTKPAKEGDDVAVCLAKPVEVALDKTRKATVVGLFKGKWCGEAPK